MTRSGKHRRSLSLSGAIYPAVAAWAGANEIAVSAAVEIAIRQWHARIQPGVIEEWFTAGYHQRRGRRLPRKMISVGHDAYGILEIRSAELGVPKAMIAEFCCACRIQRPIADHEVDDHVEDSRARTEAARAARAAQPGRPRARQADARLAYWERLVDDRIVRTIDLRRQRAAEERAFEDRIQLRRQQAIAALARDRAAGGGLLAIEDHVEIAKSQHAADEIERGMRSAACS